MNNNEETLIEDSLAQSLVCNLFTVPWDHLYNLFHISPLFFFDNVTFVKNTQFYKLHRFPSQSFYFYKTVAYVSTAIGWALVVKHVENAGPSLRNNLKLGSPNLVLREGNKALD